MLKANATRHLLRLLATAPMSMAELSEASDTGPQTLRRELAALVDAGWVTEVGADYSTGGRPARVFGLDGASHLLVGVHLELPAVRIALMALDGQVVARCDLECSSVAPPIEVVRQIVDGVRKLADENAGRRIVGLGLATPGFHNPDTGGLLSVGRQPQWDSFPIRDHLEVDLEVPVTLANDVDCMAHEEFMPGGVEEPDTVYVVVSEGVKASLWLDGRAYHGRLSNAGMVGGMSVVVEGERSVHLERVASVGAVCDAFAQHADQSEPEVAAILGIADRSDRFRAILRSAAQGHAAAGSVLDRAMSALTVGLADVVVLLQPRLIVVGGALVDIDEERWLALQDGIRARVHPLIGQQLRIRRATGGSDLAAAQGAARLAREAVDLAALDRTAERRTARV